jgi:hypothetical protein
MFRPIRVRAGSAAFCPYDTPLLFANNTPCPLSFQWVAATEPFFTGSYADRRKPPPSDSGQSCTSALGRQEPSEKPAGDCPLQREVRPHQTT